VIYPFFLYQWILRSSLSSFDCIATISHATAEELKKRSAPDSRIVTITPGIDMPSFIPRAHRNRDQLLILGRQIKRKGTVWFLSEVMPLLLKQYPSMHLTIAGDGPELPQIHTLAGADILRDHVTVLGSIDDRTKERLLQTSMLLIVPNIEVPDDMEGFGLVCTEALAHGLPVVASAREGILDAVVDTVTGVFFMSEDPASAVEAITKAMAHPWDSSLMRRTLKERYSAHIMCSRYLFDVF
jgi:glycosyltransferase involved in cell wall biosynthesis